MSKIFVPKTREEILSDLSECSDLQKLLYHSILSEDIDFVKLVLEYGADVNNFCSAIDTKKLDL